MLEPAVANTCPLVPTEVGNINVYDWPAEWAGDCIATPCEFCEQFKVILPSADDPSPLAVSAVACIVLSDITLGNLALSNVPAVIFPAFIAATLNVPNVTKSTVSPADTPEAKTTELPDVTVTSVPFTIFTPLRYTSINGESYVKLFELLSFPVNVVCPPDAVYVNLWDVPFTEDPAAAQPDDL